MKKSGNPVLLKSPAKIMNTILKEKDKKKHQTLWPKSATVPSSQLEVLRMMRMQGSIKLSASALTILKLSGALKP